jgi:hypothetical protein
MNQFDDEDENDAAAGCYPHGAIRHSRGPTSARNDSRVIRRESSFLRLVSDTAAVRRSWSQCALKNVPLYTEGVASRKAR